MNESEVQLVISVIRFTEEQAKAVGFRHMCYVSLKAWIVKLGLDAVGVVYEARPDDRWHGEKHGGRWVWEGAGSGCSLDEDQGESSYETRQEAIWALLAQHEQDQIAARERPIFGP